MPKNVHTLSDSQYSILVLQTLKRLLRRSDYYLSVLPTRNLLSNEATSSDISDALQYAITAISNQGDTAE